MADNYLENKMDDYRRGVTAKTSRRPCSCAPALSSPISIPPHNIILYISNPGLLQALLSAFYGIRGLKVAFAGTDTRECSRLAQSTGSMFVPVRQLDAEALLLLHKETARRWDSIDVIMTDRPDCLPAASVSAAVSAAGATGPAPETVVFNFCTRSSEAAPAPAMMASATVINISGSVADFLPVARVAMLLLTPHAAPISSISI